MNFPLKNACAGCGAAPGSPGVVVEVGGQQTLRCAACNRSNNYNVPKDLLGLPQAHVTRPGEVKPAKRWRIIERDGQRCTVCGRTGEPNNAIVVDHLLPIASLESVGATPEEARSDYNLRAICVECNAGKGKEPPLPRDALRVMLHVMRARAAYDAMRADKKGAA